MDAETEILEFRTFYGVLQHMAAELRKRGVTHVVLEASGVYARLSAGTHRPLDDRRDAGSPALPQVREPSRP